MDKTVLFLIGTLLLSSHALADECTIKDVEAAEQAVDHLTSWQAMNDNFTRFHQCDEGSIAEGNSEAVIRLLVDKWEALPKLSVLTRQNTAFETWVLSHIDSTLDSGDLQTAVDLATSQCPASESALCQKIVKAAQAAIHESNS
ncbi:hypothetical protein [Pseudescherichia vulneris]|uniref:hypothetical protein n=1 Tax=Pseudescherichia vulneris TaxID=566 RepID=UPI0012AB48F5|nr:hypothetical protein [Pseudescherichia vulneris]MDU5453321.1 hypothetical protein [Pseudescherichia vulneris]